MSAVGVLMAIVMLIILADLTSTADLDNDTTMFATVFIVGSLAMSFATFRIYRWLGHREPPRKDADRSQS